MRIWTRIDGFFVLEGGKKISIHFFLSLSLSSLAEARVERYSRSRWPSILSIHHRCIGATIGCRSANTSFGKSYRFSSTVCRFSPLTVCSPPRSSRFFLASFTHSLSLGKSSISCVDFETKPIDENSNNNSIRGEKRNFVGTWRGFVRGGDFAREKETTIRIGGTSEGARTAATVPAASCYRCRKDGVARRVDGWTTGGRVGVATAATAAEREREREREDEDEKALRLAGWHGLDFSGTTWKRFRSKAKRARFRFGACFDDDACGRRFFRK